MLEKTLESPLDYKEIQPVHPKGNQSWIFIGRTDAKAETPILWPPDAKSWRTGKDPEAGKDCRQEEKGATEDEMVGWHHYSMDMSLSKLWELMMDRETWRAAVHEVTKNQTWLNNWTKQTKNRETLPWCFPGGSVVMYLPSDAGQTGSIPGSGRSPGGGHGNSLQHSCLENLMDSAGWHATVDRVA